MGLRGNTRPGCGRSAQIRYMEAFLPDPMAASQHRGTHVHADTWSPDSERTLERALEGCRG